MGEFFSNLLDPFDFIIFTVKGQHTTGAAELITPIVGPNTGIISFQNGIEGIDILAARFSPGAVLPGTTMTAANIEGPGIIRHYNDARPMTIGEWNDEKSERLMAFAALAEAAGLDVTISENIHADVWAKFVGMATIASLTSLTRLSINAICNHPETRQLALYGMNEVIAIAAGRGVVLPVDLSETMVKMGESFDPTWKTSMCNDLEAGKPIELAITSATVHRLGQELAIPTPVHTFAYRALSPYAATP